MFDLTTDQAIATARACHEVNRAYCQYLGDESQLPWPDAPDWAKDSAVMGVKSRAENPSAPASASHEGWMKHKEADGWVYGETKDAGNKTHPCMVSFDDLPASQKQKDHLFCFTCQAMFAAFLA